MGSQGEVSIPQKAWKSLHMTKQTFSVLNTLICARILALE